MTVFALGSLYFWFFFRESVLYIYDIRTPVRIFDYSLFGLLLYQWLRIEYKYAGIPKNKARIYAAVFPAFRFAVSTIVTSLYMDDYYRIADRAVSEIWTIFLSICCVMCISILLASAYLSLKKITYANRRNYVMVYTGLMIILELWEIRMDIPLSLGLFGISEWEMNVIDITALIAFVMSFVTFSYIFREDFSPLYIKPPADREPSEKSDTSDGAVLINMADTEDAHALKGVSKEHLYANAAIADVVPTEANVMLSEAIRNRKLERISELHGLTEREHEVLIYLYDGFSNPMIANELVISINTVKKHVRNIYEKFDVSSRMELIHFVNSVRLKEDS